MKNKVLQTLKTKVSSLGFNEEELNEVAVSIASNLTDDATDEQVESSVNGVIPFLKISQKNASRIVSKTQKENDELKKKLEKTPDAIDEGKNKGKKEEDEMPAWFKKYQEDTEKRLAEINTQNVRKSRKETVAKLLNEKGAFGKSKMRDFERMNFTDDADFDNYLTGLKEDIEEHDKEVANTKLNIKPIGSGVSDKEFNESDLDEIANLI